MPPHQLKLFKEKVRLKRGRPRKRPASHFGGHYFRNYNPMAARPIDATKALHLVLKVSDKLSSRILKYKNADQKVWDIIRKQAGTHNIRIYEYANAGNHLHLLIRVKSQEDYVGFIRATSGLIVRLFHGILSKKPKNFWQSRPFSRIVSFGRDFRRVQKYLLRNVLEAIGWLPYYPRTRQLPQEWKLAWLGG